jgi:hypothetical protein
MAAYWSEAACRPAGVIPVPAALIANSSPSSPNKAGGVPFVSSATWNGALTGETNDSPRVATADSGPVTSR